MSFSDIGELLGTIGGALSAQASGGPQGLQSYMQILAKEASQRAAQSFERERTDRQENFARERDAVKHQQAIDLQQRAAALRPKPGQDLKTAREEAIVGALYVAGVSNTVTNQALVDQIRRAVPGAADPKVVIDLSNKESAWPWLTAYYRVGGSTRQLEESTESLRTNTDRQNVILGAPAEGDVRENLDALDLAKLQARQTGADQQINTLMTQLKSATMRLEKLDKNKGEMNPTVYMSELRGVSDLSANVTKAIIALEDEYGSDGEQADVLSAGAQSAGNLNTLKIASATLSKFINIQHASKSEQLVASWNDKADDWPGNVAGLGMRPTEAKNHEELLNGPAMKKRGAVFTGKLDYLVGMPDAQAKHLPEEAAKLRDDILVEMGPDGGRIDLPTLLRTRREAILAGQETRMADLARIIDDVGELNVPMLARDVAQNTYASDMPDILDAFSKDFARNDMLGWNLAKDQAQMERIVAEGGEYNEQLRIKMIPGDSVKQLEMVRGFLGSDEGIERIIGALLSPERRYNAPEGGEWDLTQTILEQAKDGLHRIGAYNHNIMEKLELRLREMHNDLAVIEPGMAIPHITHGYTGLAAKKVQTLHREGATSFFRMLSKDEKETWTLSVQNAHIPLTPPMNVNVAKEFVHDMVKKLRKPRRGGEFAGADLEAETAGEEGENISLLDMLAVFNEAMPKFRDVTGRKVTGIAGLFLGLPGLGKRPARPFGRWDVSAKSRQNVSEQSADLGNFTYGYIPDTYAKWAPRTGESASIIRGKNSWAKRYEEEEGPSARDPVGHQAWENKANMMGLLDFIRAAPISEWSINLPPDERILYAAMQGFIQEMDYTEARERFIDGSRGVSLDELGLVVSAPKTAAALQKDPLDLTQLAYSPTEEAAKIKKAQTGLDNAGQLMGTPVSVNVPGAESDYEIVNQALVDSTRTSLNNAATLNDAIEEAQNNPLVGVASNALAHLVINNDFTDVTSLALVLESNRASITGISVAETGSIDENRSAIDEAITAMEGMDGSSAMMQMINIYAQTHGAKASKEAGMTGARGSLLVQQVRLQLGEIHERVNAIRRRMTDYLELHGKDTFQLSDLPPHIAARLKGTNFNEMPQTTIGERTLVALRIWAAYHLLP